MRTKICTEKFDLHTQVLMCQQNELLGCVYTTHMPGPFHFYMPVTHSLIERSDPERNSDVCLTHSLQVGAERPGAGSDSKQVR